MKSTQQVKRELDQVESYIKELSDHMDNNEIKNSEPYYPPRRPGKIINPDYTFGEALHGYLGKRAALKWVLGITN